MFKTKKEKLRNAIEFTRIYKSYADINLREAACLDYQLKNILVPMDQYDLLAGRYEHDYVGFSSQCGGIYTYYFNEFDFRTALNECWNDLSEEEKNELTNLQEYWEFENTARKADNRIIQKYGYLPPKSYHGPGFFNADWRVAGTNLNMERLIDLGLDGMDELIDHYASVNGASTFYEALKSWIGSLRTACERYRQQVSRCAEQLKNGEKETPYKNTKALEGLLEDFAEEPDTAAKAYLAAGGRTPDLTSYDRLAEALENIQHHAPRSFFEGVQLMWIYSVSCDLMNYGRMDDYLGPLYCHDIENGIITEEEGIGILLGLYKHFKEINKIHDCRIIVGGVGRRHPKEADRLAIALMETSRRFRETVPQLTLRYDRDIAPEVYRKALEVNAEGTTFPIIYSDVTNVPAVKELYGVSEEEAEQYLPFGCGEYNMEGLSIGTPNSGTNLLKALEMTLHGGRDFCNNVPCGKNVGSLSDFDTFDKLYDAWKMEMADAIDLMADYMQINYDVAGEEAPYLHQSLLLSDCIEKGKACFDGGVRYLNASSEIFGLISTADSFMALKKLVYDEKKYSLSKIVEALDHNFEGYEQIRKDCLAAPKYGNDQPDADEMAHRVFRTIGEMTIAAGKKTRLHSYNIVSVNNSMSAEWGYFCSASPDGRKKGDAMSNGNGPSVGADKSGVTALLNSMSGFDNTLHVGVINNVRFTRELFESSMDKVAMLLRVFYENGGVETNLCVIGKHDLEEAMIHPENYQNLMVRIGGFSARFVTLNPTVQREIINRTTYGSC